MSCPSQGPVTQLRFAIQWHEELLTVFLIGFYILVFCGMNPKTPLFRPLYCVCCLWLADGRRGVNEGFIGLNIGS